MLWFLRHPKQALRVASQVSALQETFMHTKSPWKSKMLIVNALALLASVLQMAGVTHVELDAETQVAIIAAINFVLRLVTKQPLGV